MFSHARLLSDCLEVNFGLLEERLNYSVITSNIDWIGSRHWYTYSQCWSGATSRLVENGTQQARRVPTGVLTEEGCQTSHEFSTGQNCVKVKELGETPVHQHYRFRRWFG